MKTNHKLFSIILSLLLLNQVPAAAQEKVQGMKQVFDITPDELGNANIMVTMKLNAAQWDYYKKSIGNNTSIFKWNMQKALPKYYLSDFKVDEDQMERTFKVSFKALGLVEMDKNGKWSSKLETKNPDITKLSDREFVMTENYADNGVLIEQTQKLHLPSSVSDAKIEKDNFGKAVLTYSTGGSMLQKIMLITGIVTILIGGVMLYKSLSA